MEENSSLVLDKHFTDALIKSAIKAGYTKFKENDAEDLRLIKNFRSDRSIGLLEKRCLELALLHDEIYLNDPFDLVELEKVKSLGVVKEITYLDHDENVLNKDDIQLGEDIKPLLMNYLVKHFQKGRPHLKEIRGLTKKYVDGLYDFINLWRAGLHQEAVLHTHLPLKSLLKTNDPLNTIYTELIDRNDRYHGFAVDMIAMDFELSSVISLIKISDNYNSPFVSKRIVGATDYSEVDDLHEVFKICLIQMKNEIQFIPKIESFDDLLRLREKKEIITFREVLNEWKTLMNNGEFRIAEKVKIDVMKANKEFSKLEKWRKVDSWLYYLSIPTSIIPIVSNVVTVGSTFTRYHINKKQNKHEWIGIGL